MAAAGAQDELSGRGLAAFGDKVRRLRTARGLSLRELSALLRARCGADVSWQALARIERGKTNPKLSQVLALSRFFRVSPGRLIDDRRTLLTIKGEDRE